MPVQMLCPNLKCRKLLVVPDEQGRRVSGMIVEAEAYLGIADRAAHSYGGRRTPRNR